MKEYIKPLDTVQVKDGYGNTVGESAPSIYEVMDKINEVVGYLNDLLTKEDRG